MEKIQKKEIKIENRFNILLADTKNKFILKILMFNGDKPTLFSVSLKELLNLRKQIKNRVKENLKRKKECCLWECQFCKKRSIHSIEVDDGICPYCKEPFALIRFEPIYEEGKSPF